MIKQLALATALSLSLPAAAEWGEVEEYSTFFRAVITSENGGYLKTLELKADKEPVFNCEPRITYMELKREENEWKFEAKIDAKIEVKVGTHNPYIIHPYSSRVTSSEKFSMLTSFFTLDAFKEAIREGEKISVRHELSDDVYSPTGHFNIDGFDETLAELKFACEVSQIRVGAQ